MISAQVALLLALFTPPVFFSMEVLLLGLLLPDALPVVGP